MKKYFTLALLALLACNVYADRDDECEGNPHHCNGGGDDGAPSTLTAELHTNIGDVSTQIGDTLVFNEVAGTTVNSGDTTVKTGNTNVSLLTANVYENQYRAPNIYATPSNNTARCLKTIGFAMSGAADSGAGGTSLGYSVKDRDCQLMEDENDAFAKGDLAGGWKLYCRKTNVMGIWGYTHRRFRKDIGDRDTAIGDCVADKMLPDPVRNSDLQSQIDTLTDELGPRITKVEATQNVFMDTELADRVVTLEGAAHNPGSSELIVQ